MNRLCAVTAIVLAAAAAAWPAHAQRSPILGPKPLPATITPRVDESQCGPYRGFYGPMDFRGADPHDRRVVEEFHLDMELRTFLGGQVSGNNRAGTGAVAGGFDYTLNSFPNHPAALALMEQLGRRLGSEEPQGTRPLECWYGRAFKLVPDDPVVWVMYGVYLAHRARTTEALPHLDRAANEVTISAPMLHQLDMAHLTAKQYEKTQLAAMRAQSLGFKITPLQEQLKSLGRWNTAFETKFLNDMQAEAQSAAAEAASALVSFSSSTSTSIGTGR